MKISIASDHAGFEQKQKLVEYLRVQGHDVRDLGPDTDDRVDYPDFAERVACDVAESEVREAHEVAQAESQTTSGATRDASKNVTRAEVLSSRATEREKTRTGVLVCGTGIGMAIAANKVPGIRAANVTTPEFAKLAREHNDANVVALSGRFVDLDTNKAILDAFLSTPFGGGRHAGRVKKIMDIERKCGDSIASKS